MASSEHARHRMYGQREGVTRAEEAATLMAHLASVSWADAATKHGLGRLAELIRRGP